MHRKLYNSNFQYIVKIFIHQSIFIERLPQISAWTLKSTSVRALEMSFSGFSSGARFPNLMKFITDIQSKSPKGRISRQIN